MPANRTATCILLLLVAVGGCDSSTRGQSEAQVDLKLTPSPPLVGTADVEVSLATPDGQPLDGAEVRLEGNMNHAGMKPSFADLQEVEPGKYTGQLELTMGGDWYVLVTATTADGRRIERTIDVPGVKAP